MGLKESENYDNVLQTIQYDFNRGYVEKTNKKEVDLKNKYWNILTENVKIVHINIDELSKLWYSESRKQYSKNYQILCGISALIGMVCTKKSKLEEELKEIPLEEEIEKLK